MWLFDLLWEQRFFYVQNIGVHGFADASLAVYVACIYVHTKNKNGNCTLRLLCTKSKVSPFKSNIASTLTTN